VLVTVPVTATSGLVLVELVDVEDDVLVELVDVLDVVVVELVDVLDVVVELVDVVVVVDVVGGGASGRSGPSSCACATPGTAAIAVTATPESSSFARRFDTSSPPSFDVGPECTSDSKKNYSPQVNAFLGTILRLRDESSTGVSD
jgi:hypothetical protein